MADDGAQVSAPSPDADSNAESVPLTVVTRAGWEALPPTKPILPLAHPVENVVMAYNTGVQPCFTMDECKVRMRELQKLHMDYGLSDIHYNFAIGTDGNVYEGRGWHSQPEPFMDRPELDEKGLCIGVIGDGQDPDPSKPLELITAIYLANHGVDKGYVHEDYEVVEDDQTFGPAS